MFYSFFCKTKTLIFITSRFLSFLHNNGVIRFVSTITSNEPSSTVSYLVNSCGFSLKSAAAVSAKIHFDSPERLDCVISFFKNHGFSQTQIRTLIQRKPEFLSYDPDKILLPKFQFFYSKGISGSELATIVSSNLRVFGWDLHNCIIPNFNSFKDFTHWDDNKVFRTYKSCSSILECNFQSLTAPNRAVLQDYGVPESNIMTLLAANPRVLTFKHDRFRRAVEEVKKMGFNPSKANFLSAVKALLAMSKSTWERRSDVYKQWGWSDEDIVSAFEKFPDCMRYSEHKITATMNFYVNTMGLRSSYIANHPIYLGFSLEKRIIPRWSVLQALLSKDLIDKIYFSLLLTCTEKKFLQNFVTPYNDPYLLKLYKEKLGLSE